MVERLGEISIITGITGGGKTSTRKKLLEELQSMVGSTIVTPISITNRDARPGEINRVHYEFMKDVEIAELDGANLLAFNEPYYGNRYAMRRTFVDDPLKQGQIVFMETVPPAAEKLYRHYRALGHMVRVAFLIPPGFDDVVERLTHTKETPEFMEERFGYYPSEFAIAERNGFEVITNHDLAQTSQVVRAFLFPGLMGLAQRVPTPTL